VDLFFARDFEVYVAEREDDRIGMFQEYRLAGHLRASSSRYLWMFYRDLLLSSSDNPSCSKLTAEPPPELSCANCFAITRVVSLP